MKYYVVFWFWLLALLLKFLRFIHVTACTSGSFLLLRNIPVYGWNVLFIQYQLMDIWVSFEVLEYCCYECLCVFVCTCVFTSLHTVMASLLHLAAAAVFLNPVTINQWKEHLFVCLFFETPSCLVSPMGLPWGISMSTDVHGRLWPGPCGHRHEQSKPALFKWSIFSIMK